MYQLICKFNDSYSILFTYVILKDGKWGTSEIKLGSSTDVIKEASTNLKSVSEIIDPKYFKKPCFLIIVTGDKYAYKTEYGIHGVPITVLKN